MPVFMLLNKSFDVKVYDMSLAILNTYGRIAHTFYTQYIVY